MTTAAISTAAISTTAIKTVVIQKNLVLWPSKRLKPGMGHVFFSTLDQAVQINKISDKIDIVKVLDYSEIT